MIATDEINSRAITGGGATLLSGSLDIQHGIFGNMLSPDGRVVLFVASDAAGQALYRVGISGGGATRLLMGGSLLPTGISITPDNRHAIAIAYQPLGQGFGPATVYSALLDGSGAPVTLSAGQAFVAFAYSTEDSALVLYGEVIEPELSAGVLANPLLSVKVDGDTPVQLNRAPGDAAVTMFGLPPFPGAQREVFIAGGELFDVAATGAGAVTNISGGVSGNATVTLRMYVESGAKVVYQAGTGLFIADRSGGGSGGPPVEPPGENMFVPILPLLLDDD